MTTCRTIKKGIYADTDINCQNCDSLKRVCTWKGDTKMKCPNCDGTGNIANGMWLCCECQGTGFIEDEKPSEPMTNEEWLDTLTTHKKARWLRDISCESYYRAFGNDTLQVDFWEKWLKEAHK